MQSACLLLTSPLIVRRVILLLFYILLYQYIVFFFFFNDTATTEIYTLSLHDALPIYPRGRRSRPRRACCGRYTRAGCASPSPSDRKSTRLNSSHDQISYAVFCLKKKK